MTSATHLRLGYCEAGHLSVYDLHPRFVATCGRQQGVAKVYVAGIYMDYPSDGPQCLFSVNAVTDAQVLAAYALGGLVAAQALWPSANTTHA